MVNIRISKVFLILATFAATPLHAGDGAWTVHSPPGVQVRDLAATPAQAGRLYAASRGAGVFRSDDGGESWTAVNGGLDHLDISAIAVSPTDPDRAVAAPVNGTLMRTVDAGATWTDTTEGHVEYVVELAYRTDDETRVFALDATGGIVRSHDGGGTWQRNTAGLTADEFTSLAVGSLDSGRVWVGTERGVFLSGDDGHHWSPVDSPWDSDTAVVDLTTHFGDGSGLIALFETPNGVRPYTYFDNNHWEGQWPGTADAAMAPGPRVITTDPHATAEYRFLDGATRALIGGQAGIHASVDAGTRFSLGSEFYGGGNHWVELHEGFAQVGIDPAGVHELLFDPTVNLRYFAVVDGTILRYEGPLGADLRLKGRAEDKYYNPAGVFGVSAGPEDNPNRSVYISFVVGNMSVGYATDVVLDITLDPGVTLDNWGAPTGCHETASGLRCELAELPSFHEFDGGLIVSALSDGNKEFTFSVTASERDPTPGSNAATYTRAMVGPEPLDDDSGESDESPPKEPTPEEPTPEESPPEESPPEDSPPEESSPEESSPEGSPANDTTPSSPSSTSNAGGGGGGVVGLCSVLFVWLLKILAPHRRRTSIDTSRKLFAVRKARPATMVKSKFRQSL